MGEYFKWVNPKKKEFIECNPFGNNCSFMFNIARCLGDGYTDAACNLIKTRWHGDPVAYVGDYWWPDEVKDKVPEHIYNNFLGATIDPICCEYKDITGEFNEARGYTYTVYENEECKEVEYTGSFRLHAHHYRYAINESKQVYIDRNAAPISEIWAFSDGTYFWDRDDPVTNLYVLETYSEMFDISWCCDVVTFSDEIPRAPFKDATEFYCTKIAERASYYNNYVNCADEQMNEIVYSKEFQNALIDKEIGLEDFDKEYRSKRLYGAVDVLAGFVK